jgi:hypothetical protein
MQLYETYDSTIHVQWKIQTDYVEMAWGSIEFLCTYVIYSKKLKLALFMTYTRLNQQTLTIINTILFQRCVYVPDIFKQIRIMLRIILLYFSP